MRQFHDICFNVFMGCLLMFIIGVALTPACGAIWCVVHHEWVLAFAWTFGTTLLWSTLGIIASDGFDG